ncbi:MAG: hypothetical protein ABIH08_01665 [Candidatus Omnitrophota bacterium]
MRGVCAVFLDEDGAFISFGVIKKGSCVFLQELKVPLLYKNNSIADCLRENLDIFAQKIKEIQKKYSFNVEKVFLEMPYRLCGKEIVEEIFPLKRRKKITLGDISFIKKRIEDKFLSWDDSCIHNIVLSCEIEGSNYQTIPLGVWAQKIKLQSLLIWVKEKIYKDIEDVFDNLDINFAGFVASAVSIFSTAFAPSKVYTGIQALQAAVSIDYTQSRFICADKNGFIYADEFDFGLKKIIEELSKKFIFPFALAQEVFERYISFKEVPYFKEITVKKEEGYMNLSTQTLNSFAKDYIAGKIKHILSRVKDKTQSDDFVISFSGRLNAKEGFYGFLKDYIFTELKPPAYKPAISSSSGCLHYGVSPFLDNDCKRARPFLQRILDVYREYF